MQPELPNDISAGAACLGRREASPGKGLNEARASWLMENVAPVLAMERQVHETCFASIIASSKALRFPRFVLYYKLQVLLSVIFPREIPNHPPGPDLPY
jgi:hypothetical protein